MLTVEKLLKTIAYEEKQTKEREGIQKKAVSNLPIFNNITSEEDWNKQKEEIRKAKELELKKNVLELKKKREENLKKIEEEKKKKQFSLPMFNHITNEADWKRERQKLRVEYNKIQQQRSRSKEEACEERNKETHKKVLEYRERLQHMSDERNRHHSSMIQKDIHAAENQKKVLEWYSNEKEEQLKRLKKRQERNAQTKQG